MAGRHSRTYMHGLLLQYFGGSMGTPSKRPPNKRAPLTFVAKKNKGGRTAAVEVEFCYFHELSDRL